MTDQRKRALKRRLQESRYRLLQMNEPFALPLKDMTFIAVEDVYRMSTNGNCIYFDGTWLMKSDKRAIDFMLSHQLMHIHMGHIQRPEFFRGDRFHLACDIVANSELELLGWYYEKIAGVGTLYHETFFPAADGKTLTAQEAIRGIPFDPAVMPPSKRRKYMIDSELYWERQGEEWGMVVLSPEDSAPEDLSFEYTAGGHPFYVKKEDFDFGLDDNSSSNVENDDAPDFGMKWESVASDGIEAVRYIKSRDKNKGSGSGRFWQDVDIDKLDWRNMLNSFIQNEIHDYSFTPPDRRYGEGEFFLPDFNSTSVTPTEILFAVDTSASVSDRTLSVMLSEIRYALTQFDGKIMGRLVFFDTRVYPADIGNFDGIVPVGGGATDMGCVFDYLEKLTITPGALVVCTDGLAAFPDESRAGGIPVLWLLTGLTTLPPWGKAARIMA